MGALFRTLTIRYLWQRWDRAVLVALSIALGVATLVSSRLMNRCMEAAAYDSTVPVDIADLYISNGEVGVAWDIVEDLKKAQLTGIKKISPFVFERVSIVNANNRPAVLFGADLKEFGKDSQGKSTKAPFQVTVLNPTALQANWIAISRAAYDDLKAQGWQESQPIQVRYSNESIEFVVLAILDVDKDTPLTPYANQLVITDVRQAAKLTRVAQAEFEQRSADRINRIDLFLDGTTPLETVREEVAKVVGKRAAIRTPTENRKSTDEIVGSIRLVLDVGSLGALVVGLFLVYNALAVTVAERRHDIGVMRSIGATRPQIAILFTLEAAFIGIIGALLGIPIGQFMSDLVINEFGKELDTVFLSGQMPRPTVDAKITSFALLAGVTVALLAALVPALQAASDEPADAVRRSPDHTGGILILIYRFSIVALITLGLTFLSFRKQIAPQLGSTFGLFFLLTGLFLAMPIFISVLAKILLPLIRLFLSVESRLAVDNLVRSPGRTGVVIGALAAGVCLMFQTSGVGRSNQVPVTEWLDTILKADAYILRGDLAQATSSQATMSPEVGLKIRQEIPGVQNVVGLRYSRPEYEGAFILMIALDSEQYKQGMTSRAVSGHPRGLESIDQLTQGDYVIVSDNFMVRYNKKPGDVITIPSPKGPLALTIAGSGLDYSWNRGTIFIDRKRYQEYFNDPFIDLYHVFFHQPQDPVAYKALEELCAKEAVLVQNQESVTLYLSAMITRIFRVAYLQQLIVASVAALGVVMALLISVLQRRRELGLLRAVGATRFQVMKTVLAEAFWMGVFGTLLGFLLGIPMEWFLLKVVMWEESGFYFPMLIPWLEAGGIALVAVLASLIAGIIPAAKAVGLNIPEAIAYE